MPPKKKPAAAAGVKCAQQTGAKYTTRSSPPFPANACCGKTRDGNDNLKYRSVADKNGRCRWVLDASSRVPLHPPKGADVRVVIKCQGNYGMYVVHLLEASKRAIIFETEEDSAGREVLVQRKQVAYDQVLFGYDMKPPPARDWLGRQKRRADTAQEPTGLLLRTSPGQYLLVADDKVLKFRTVGKGAVTEFSNKTGPSGTTLPILQTSKHFYKLDSQTFDDIAVVAKTPEVLRMLEENKSRDSREEDMPALYHLTKQRPELESRAR